MLSIIKECFIDPFSKNPLLSISNGILATEKFVSDSFNGFKLGAEHMDTFIKEQGIKKSKDFSILLKELILKHFLN